MPRVIVCGSAATLTVFSVVDATNPGNLSPAVQANATFGGACTVAVDGAIAVVGNLNGNQVQLFDLTDPHRPVAKGMTSAQIASLGAVAIRGNLVAVGEAQDNRIALIDITDLNNPRLITTFATVIPGFSSLAFVNRATVVGAGQAFQFVMVDFSNPMIPQETPHDPQFGGAVTVDADPNAQLIAAVSIQSRQVKLFDQNLNELASVDSQLPGVMSVSLSGRRALVGGQITSNVSLIDFNANQGTVFNGMVGNATVAFDGQFGACAAVAGSSLLNVFDLRVAPNPNPVGTLPNAGIASVTSMSMQSFQSALLPNIAASPLMLAFGAVQVTTSVNLTVQIQNTGQATLTVNAIQTSDPAFVLVNAPANMAIQPRNTALLTVRFMPAVVGQINANLTMATNVPGTPNFSVPLSGAGVPAVPDIAAMPPNLAFGAVELNTTADLTVQIENTGHAPLTVDTIQTSDLHFTLVNAPANLAISPGNSAPLTVRFMPTAVGQFNANLTMMTNVPGTPNFSVPLSGTGKIVVAFDPAPRQFDPSAGVWDSLVTLFGKNFDIGPVRIQFSPQDLPRSPVSVTSTRIVAKVPAGTGEGPLAGPVPIIVTNDAGTATSDDLFTVIPT